MTPNFIKIHLVFWSWNRWT